MSVKEILDTARQAVDAGYRTIVLQSGEDPSLPQRNAGGNRNSHQRDGSRGDLELRRADL